MAKSYLISVLSRRSNVPELLQSLISPPEEWLAVEDENGQLLFGEKKDAAAGKMPVYQEGAIVGWVWGNGKTRAIASLLSLLLDKESEKKKVGNEALNLYREINLIYNFSEKIAAAISPAAIGKMALEEAGSFIPFSGAAVVLWDDEQNLAQLIAQSGSLFFNAEELRDDNSFIFAAATGGQTRIVERAPIVVMHAALRVKHRVMGGILLARDGQESFSAAELKLLTTLAQQSASAIETLLLLEKTVWKTLELEREKMDAENVKSLSELKSQFFTNITHEFRTPLTVVLGMTGQLRVGLEAGENRDVLLANLQLIHRNGQDLLRLINQLLDFSKLEQGGFQLHPQRGDVVAFIKYHIEPYQTYAANQDLDFQFKTNVGELVMDFDRDQLGHVLTNLLSNALKFTPPGGTISVSLSLPSSAGLTLTVADTGKGIPGKDLPYIFDRFYQAGGTSGGTGIGLAHARELVKLMGGDISVESSPGSGSVFTVTIPVPAVSSSGSDLPALQIERPEVAEVPVVGLPVEKSEAGKLPVLLVVEDNADIVAYLVDCLKNIYRIETARNGKEGIEKAFSLIPDVVISDVMMPEMDGFEVVDTLKNDERTSHVPIILLTAKADAASRLEGLRRGADAYLPKPFDREELLVRLEKLIELRKRLRERYREQFYSETASSVPEEAAGYEDQFIQKIKDILAGHISDEDFGLPELCKKIGMSRSQLFRKMKALIDEPPSGFIRSYRLHHARNLLLSTGMSVSEVAYEVGFKDPAHFSKAFHEAFGIPPSASRG